MFIGRCSDSGGLGYRASGWGGGWGGGGWSRCPGFGGLGFIILGVSVFRFLVFACIVVSGLDLGLWGFGGRGSRGFCCFVVRCFRTSELPVLSDVSGLGLLAVLTFDIWYVVSSAVLDFGFF